MDVYFPAAADFVETARVSAPRSEDYSGMETILVVEDEPLIRAFIKQILGSYGYHVLEACDGTNAIDVTRDNSGLIQLLITDVLLPDISGTDVARQLRQLRPDLAVIFISGQAFEEMREAVSQVSPTGFLLKPFRAVDLLTKVRAILDTCVDRSVSTSTS